MLILDINVKMFHKTSLLISNFVERKIPECIKNTMMPIENQMLFWYLFASFNNKFKYSFEVLFTQRYFTWVDVCFFESSEE